MKTPKKSKKDYYSCSFFVSAQGKSGKNYLQGDVMKKLVVVLALGIGLITALCLAISKQSATLPTTAYVRVHIRANSNDSIDQAVKYQVRNAVVDYLTPIIAECQTVNDAHNALSSHLGDIDSVANGVLSKAGFSYKAKSRINDEYFPTRAYNDIVLNEGVYDALIVDLGSGTGDNWWCVIYPPLCFIGAENTGANGIIYKSKIVEIINKFL